MISDELEKGATLRWDEDGPWAQPPRGPVLTVDLSVATQLTRKLRTPPEILPAYGPGLPWDVHQLQGQQVAEEGDRRLEESLRHDPLPYRHREVDQLYMEFAGAAEHLLLQRQGHVSTADEMRRGWPLEVQEVPLLPARPQGWLAQPSGLSQWVALKVHFISYLTAIRRGREEAAITCRTAIGRLCGQLQSLPKILDDRGTEESDMLNSILALRGESELVTLRVQALKQLIRKLEYHLLRGSHRRFSGVDCKQPEGWSGRTAPIHLERGRTATSVISRLQPGWRGDRAPRRRRDCGRAKAAYWGELWQAAADAPRSADWWPELRRRAALEERLEVGLEDLRHALRCFKAKIGQGGDRTKPAGVASAP